MTDRICRLQSNTTGKIHLARLNPADRPWAATLCGVRTYRDIQPNFAYAMTPIDGDAPVCPACAREAEGFEDPVPASVVLAGIAQLGNDAKEHDARPPNRDAEEV